MISATDSSSRFYFPGTGERLARERAQSYERRVAETLDRKKRFVILNDWLTAKGAWCTSLPGDSMVTMECLPTSRVPDELRERGYQLEPDDPAEGQRIVAAGRIDHVVVEGSRAGIRTAREGIVTVKRYVFPL